MKIIITCDRCKRTVEGLEDKLGTSGFYRRDEYWGRFMNADEDEVCDDCMQGDDRYKSFYLRGDNQ